MKLDENNSVTLGQLKRVLDAAVAVLGEDQRLWLSWGVPGQPDVEKKILELLNLAAVSEDSIRALEWWATVEELAEEEQAGQKETKDWCNNCQDYMTSHWINVRDVPERVCDGCDETFEVGKMLEDGRE